MTTAITPYLFFNGACREAMTAYAKVFGAPEPSIMRMSDMPGEQTGASPDPDPDPDLVMHAALDLGGNWIFASDDSSRTAPAMAGCNVHADLDTVEEARAAFDALADGGEVRMPFEPSFWSPGFGALTDRWGTRWMISVKAPQEG